jgi:hypothetical protein
MRAAGVVLTVVVAAGAWSVGSVSAASPAPSTPSASDTIAADLDGQSIKPQLIPKFYCHDFDFPRIHCFRSPATLAKAEARWGARDGRLTTMTAAFGASDYITIYDGPNFGQAFMDVSQNYDTLAFIGWNDVISSYKGRNSANGELWTDWFASGTGRLFCCNTQVSSLPSSLDNAFTSVYRH